MNYDVLRNLINAYSIDRTYFVSFYDKLPLDAEYIGKTSIIAVFQRHHHSCGRPGPGFS